MQRFLLFVALFSTLGTPRPFTANLKFAPGSLAPWSVSIRGTGTAVLASEAHTGGVGLTTSGPTTKGVIVSRDVADLTPGQILLVSVWVKSAAASTHPISLLAQDSKGNGWVSIDYVPTPAWHEITQVYTVNDTRALRIELFEPPGATETVYWDDVNIQEIALSELKGDAGRGAGAYGRRCGNCHELDANQRGPQLRKVFDSRSATVPKFFYSDSLRRANVVWDEATLDKWLANPDALVPNNDMHYGADDKIERLDIIAYLKELTVSSK